MFKHPLHLAVFLVGLLAVCWIGVGYIGSNPLGTVVALVIAACYLAGALELYRYRQATDTLRDAVGTLGSAPSSLGEWLARLHPSLRNAVRLRVEGERVALSAPVLTPYLVGLLVLLGMLGTLLGMMATLRGTGLALESATDLQAMRGSLAAPVKGLGFAFGTSIAGVASSAMLGLLSALCRRDRLRVVQDLDVHTGTTLRIYSQAHQREESFRLLQKQTEAMPTLIDRLQAMMSAIEQQSVAVGQQQLASHEAFRITTEATYARLASSVEKSLKDSVTESARAAGAAFQPVIDATMEGLVRETSALHDTVTRAVQGQLEGLSSGFEKSNAVVSALWTDAVVEQKRANETVAESLRQSHEQFAATFGESSAQLLEGVDQRSMHLFDGIGQQSATIAASFDKQSALLVESFAERSAHLVDVLTQGSASLVDDVGRRAAEHAERIDQRSAELLEGFGKRLDASSHAVAESWKTALSEQGAFNEAVAARNEKALASATETFGQHATSWISSVQHSHAELQHVLESRDQERLAAWTDALTGMAHALGTQWEKSAAISASQQQDICSTLERTANDISAQAQARASDTIAEISRLVDAASEAPKVAAEVVAELRQKLSDSMVRDTAMLDERSRLTATLETLLDAVNHASTEQRTAVDALVTTSADLLDRVGGQFIEHIEGETGKLGAVAAQVTASAIEVASLGEAFGAAVQMIGGSNDSLVERLELIAGALDRSMVRSDEQLAYYVAQAREVIDLSVLSQKQIIDDLQHLAEQRTTAVVDGA